MEEFTIERAEEKDLSSVLAVYRIAREFMRETGNPNQWGENKPSPETLLEDIRLGQLFVVKKKNVIHACFVFFIGEEITYEVIEDGQWKSESLYGVIHRVASDQTQRGILPLILSFAKKRISHLRIDTHRDNKVMQHLLKKNGFEYCGIIHLLDGDERLAFELIIQ